MMKIENAHAILNDDLQPVSVSYAAVQNGVILDIYPDYDSAYGRVKDEQRNDLIQIILQRKLRKLFKKSGDIALHRYSVITIMEVTDIK